MTSSAVSGQAMIISRTGMDMATAPVSRMESRTRMTARYGSISTSGAMAGGGAIRIALLTGRRPTFTG